MGTTSETGRPDLPKLSEDDEPAPPAANPGEVVEKPVYAFGLQPLISYHLTFFMFDQIFCIL